MERTPECTGAGLAAQEVQGHPDTAREFEREQFLLRPTAPTSIASAAPASMASTAPGSMPSAAPMELVVETVPREHRRPREPSGPGRLLDLVVGAAIFLLVLPLMAVCALAIRLSSRGPVIYRQERIGRSGRHFTCFKFRTMVDGADRNIGQILTGCSRSQAEWEALVKLRSDPRVTGLGRVMRRYSLDELPQLFNVLKGDMSVVGPRPIVADEIHRYGASFADYCNVKPGLTGLWQVSGRHALSYEERVRLDAQYAQNKSLKLDLQILLKTVPVVLLGQNE